MTSDEIDVFRQARPQAPGLDPAARDRIRGRLLEAARAKQPDTAPAPRERSRWRAWPFLRLGAVAAVTAAVMVGAVVLRQAGGPASEGTSTTRVLGPPAGSARPASPDHRPRSDQWSYVRGVSAGSSKGTGGILFGKPDRKIPYERWVSADGRRSAVFKDGKLVFNDLTGMRYASPRTDYPYLLSLPTDPDALLAEVYRQTDEKGEVTEAKASRAFEIMEMFMRGVALPADLRAAMYRALPKIPGVRFENRAVDLEGRAGVTFYRIEEGYIRSEIIVDPHTHQYMGYRAVAIKDHVSEGTDMTLDIDKGHVMGWGALLQAAVVDRPGERP